MPLSWFLPVASFLTGLFFGSFFNVCIYRIPRRKSIIHPPSHC
ncbi:MAG: prepilin peptidase, partial [candidate division WOR-3 bacterium]